MKTLNTFNDYNKKAWTISHVIESCKEFTSFFHEVIAHKQMNFSWKLWDYFLYDTLEKCNVKSK